MICVYESLEFTLQELNDQKTATSEDVFKIIILSLKIDGVTTYNES